MTLTSWLGTSRIRGRAVLCAAVLILASAAGLLAQEADPGWPRDIIVPTGTITIYQPQAEDLKGNVFTGRAATSYLKTGGTSPVFGVLWFEARLNVDRDSRNGELENVQITRVRFPNATPDQEQRYIDTVQDAISNWPTQPISMDRLIAMLQVAKKDEASEEQLKNDPPVILFKEAPALLVCYDGAPTARDIPNSKLQRVINTAYPVVYDPATKTYYLTNTKLWYGASDPLGPWKLGATPPPEVVAAIPPDAKEQAKDDESPLLSTTPPEIVTATVPTELIWFDGRPNFLPVGSAGDLLYVENTDGNVFMDVKSKSYFVLISGRWFTGASLAGPWTFVKPSDLPKSFNTIPPSSSKGPVRASVPGTEESKDAIMDTQIPQTAAVKRGPAADVQTSFDGEAQFKAVEGTDLQYAVNTAQQILKWQDKYYLCKDGIWYSASSPSGPWEVSDKRPEGVDKIPASNPLYNTKYVQVYDSTPDVVYVGYTPGYMGAYPYYGTVVYGTGYYYPGWVGAYYYPWAWTWGWGAYYSPYYGWGMGAGFGWGFAWGFAWGAAWNHWGWGGGYWGAGGMYNNIRINNINIGRGNLSGNWPGQGGNRPGQGGNKPGQGGNRPGQGGAKPSQQPANNLYNRGNNPERKASKDQVNKSRQDMANRPQASKGKANNVFAGNDGQVYRRDAGGGWQQNGKNGWSNVSSPKAGTMNRPGGGQGAGGGARPGGGQGGIGGGAGGAHAGTMDRPGGGGMQGLNNDAMARQRGSAQTSNWNRGGGGYGGGGYGGGYRGGGGGGRGGGGGGRRR
jgi:hypothetical protein